jgi:hypothetical protein
MTVYRAFQNTWDFLFLQRDCHQIPPGAMGITQNNAHIVFRNRVAGCIMREMDTKTEKAWGEPDLNVWGRISSVLLVREDRKDITSQRIEAFYEFCRSEVAPPACKASKMAQATKELILRKYLRGDMFHKFFTKFKEQKLRAGDLSWTDASNPQGEYLGSLLSSMESVD